MLTDQKNTAQSNTIQTGTPRKGNAQKSTARKRIGIFGGAFNPVHYGHLMIGEVAADQCGLDRVIFLPSGHAPHKQFLGDTMAHHRYEMTRLAIAQNPHFAISDYEVTSGEVTYTTRSLDHFRDVYLQDELYFIVGADSLFDFETWRDPAGISEKCILLAAVRAEMNAERVDAQIAYLRKKFGGDIRRLDTPNFAISSREIRERIAAGRTVRYMIPASVEEYIKTNGLYAMV